MRALYIMGEPVVSTMASCWRQVSMLKSWIPKRFQIPGCVAAFQLCAAEVVFNHRALCIMLLPDINGAVKRVNWRSVTALYCYSQAWHGFYWCFALSMPDNQLGSPPTMRADWENSIKLVQGRLAVKFPKEHWRNTLDYLEIRKKYEKMLDI